MIHRHRGNRRFRDYTKAARKAKIVKDQGNYWNYGESLHRLDKGKIHCSCPMCSAKTNANNQKSMGPVQEHEVPTSTGGTYKYSFGTRLSVTNGRYGKKNYKISDKKQIDTMDEKEREYVENDLLDE